MGKKLFVGNLAYALTEEELRAVFSQAGTCESVSIVVDRDTGQSRGFGFVVMATAAEAERAMRELDGTEVQGRRLRIDQANDQSMARGGPAGRLRGRAAEASRSRP
jgi:RNA recognition motif-containing protein